MEKSRKTIKQILDERYEAMEYSKMLEAYANSIGKMVSDVNALPKNPSVAQVKIIYASMKFTHKRGMRLITTFTDACKLEKDPIRQTYLSQAIQFTIEKQKILSGLMKEFDKLLTATIQSKAIDFESSFLQFKEKVNRVNWEERKPK